MGRKAKHHYIPKSYLKEFTEGGEDSSQFWCVPVNNEAPFQTSPNKACAERDYYTIQHSNPLLVEDWYAEKIEPKIRRSICHIIENSSLPPKEEIQSFLLLLATLYLRVPSFRELIEAPMNRTKEIIDDMSKDIRITNKDEFDYNQTDVIRSEVKLIDKVQSYLSNKYYQLYVTNSAEAKVITSDSPFLLSHPNDRKGFYFGLNTPNIEILVPITKNAFVIARNEKIVEGTFKASNEFVGLANTKTILSARRFFYSSSADVLLVDDSINAYKHNIVTKQNV